MPASKHFDLVLGIDFHLVLPPGSSTPVLLPHPFIGFVFDVLDYIPYFSNGLKINGVPSATAGSVGLNFPHQPSGGGSFVKEIENDCVLFMGSSKTYVAGSPLSYMGLPVLSCQCVGIAKPAQLSLIHI